MTQEWRPIATYKPKDGEVLLYFPLLVRPGRPEANLPPMRKVGRPGEVLRAASHWMPIPPNPIPDQQ